MCHFLEHQHVTLHCWRNGAWTSCTEVLFGTGVLYDASGCSVTASEFRMLPELLGNTKATPDTPRLYVPKKIAIIACQEPQVLEEIIPLGIM